MKSMMSCMDVPGRNTRGDPHFLEGGQIGVGDSAAEEDEDVG